MICQIIFSGENKKNTCIAKSNFLGKRRKIFQDAVCCNFYPECKVLTHFSLDHPPPTPHQPLQKAN